MTASFGKGPRRVSTAESPTARDKPRPIERVRGTHDRASDAQARSEALRAALLANTRAHGYAAIDTPVIEHTELFLRKSGGERIAQLYAFQHRGRELALRPEFTASVARYYVEHAQGEPLPARYAYCGPVFRYEKPQAGRARQFTEFGCELLGATGALADVEIIALALDGLRLAGVAQPRLVLGHIGVVIDFLAGLDIDQRAQDWLTWSMERLRRGDAGAHELPPHLLHPADAPHGGPVLPEAELDEVTAIGLLEQVGVRFEGGVRAPEEIVRGLFAKRRRRHDPAVLQDAIDFVARLTELSGPPSMVLEPLRTLVRSRGLSEAPLDELADVVRLLAASGQSDERVTIDLGMGRGLHYYTGVLFEIYAADANGPQLCGGGRYDDLAQLLGARQPTPACGFSYGLERLLAAGDFAPVTDAPRRALVLPGDAPDAALRLARELRAAGWSATLDLRARNASATRRLAERQGYAVLAAPAGAGMELTRLADGVTRSWLLPPTPAEALDA